MYEESVVVVEGNEGSEIQAKSILCICVHVWCPHGYVWVSENEMYFLFPLFLCHTHTHAHTYTDTHIHSSFHFCNVLVITHSLISLSRWSLWTGGEREREKVRLMRFQTLLSPHVLPHVFNHAHVPDFRFPKSFHNTKF